MPVVIANIAANLPEKLWLGAVSRCHKDATLHILSYAPTTEVMTNTLTRVEGGNIPQILEDIKKHPNMVEMTVVEQGNSSALVTTKGNFPILVLSAMESGAMIKLPLKVKDGVIRGDAIGSRDSVSTLINALEGRGVTCKLKSIKEYVEKPILTERQREAVDAALVHGYYEIPKKITLEKLADRLGLSKSTVSETLRAAEKKMLSHKV